jgi:hypothetical protein
VIVGSKNSVSAPSPQTLGGTNYEFTSWSDGGARSHDIVAPDTANTYTATFAATSTPCTKTGTANAETISGTSGDDVICAQGGSVTSML